MTSLCRTCDVTFVAAAVVLCGTAVVRGRTASRGPTPVPKVVGPVPRTADSYPLLAADKTMKPIDLQKRGYIEEEFFVSGLANVYDWGTDGALTVKTSNAPYTTRILVRRPKDPARFSGNVVVEMLHTTGPIGAAKVQFEYLMPWSWLYDYMLDQGDAWVGITMKPAAIKA